MKLRRKATAIMLSAAMLVGTETGRISAQDTTPDLRMLMNLDLFEPRTNEAKGAPSSAASSSPPTDDSMLTQIRTLDAMGYLGTRADAGRNGESAPRAAVGNPPAADVAPAEAPAQRPIPASQPSNDVEGPLP
ncbi:MAG: hypothetical protein WBQ86_14560 [Candidatus Binatus sp.]